MKLVCCYTPGQLRPPTVDAFAAHWPDDLCLHELDPDDIYAYGETLDKYWFAAEGFAVVEPDIIIRADVTDAFLNCPEPYCAFPYAWTTNIGPALGCTRFRAEFIQKYPAAMRDTLDRGVGWRQLDVILMRHILARNHGEQPHVHLPAVWHLNEKKQLLPEADPTPMLSVPLW